MVYDRFVGTSSYGKGDLQMRKYYYLVVTHPLSRLLTHIPSVWTKISDQKDQRSYTGTRWIEENKSYKTKHFYLNYHRWSTLTTILISLSSTFCDSPRTVYHPWTVYNRKKCVPITLLVQFTSWFTLYGNISYFRMCLFNRLRILYLIPIFRHIHKDK